MVHDNTFNCDWEKENNDVTPIQQSQEDRCGHIACAAIEDCIKTNNMPANMTMRSSPSPIKGETRTKSGQTSHRPVKCGINT